MASIYGSDEGKKISAYPSILINKETFPNRIDYTTYLFGYANTGYGVKHINKNYKVPMNDLRLDVYSYIGIENIKPGWRDMISIWNGYWHHTDNTQNYLYNWINSKNNTPDYNGDKFNGVVKDKILTNTKQGINNDKIFILKTAPIPMEEGHDDKFNENEFYSGQEDEKQLYAQKIVNKTYIDDRFNGCRIVEAEVEDNKATINFRPYSCYYYINQPITKAIKHINFNVGNYNVKETVLSKLQNKRLTFNLRLENHEYYHYFSNNKNTIKFSVNNNKDQVIFDNNFSLTSLLSEEYNYYYIKCEAYIENGELKIMLKSDGNITDKELPAFDNSRNIKYLEIGSETQNIKLYEYDEDLIGNTFVTELKGDIDVTTRTEVVTTEEGVEQTVEYEELNWINTEDNIISFALKDPRFENNNDDEEGHASWAFENNKEYIWEFFVLTPKINDYYKKIDNSIPVQWDIDDTDYSIIWASSEDPSSAPELKPNKLYCFEFTKLTNGIFIGRIKYFVSLLKKNKSVI